MITTFTGPMHSSKSEGIIDVYNKNLQLTNKKNKQLIIIEILLSIYIKI